MLKKERGENTTDWLDSLSKLVSDNNLVLIRFSDEDWAEIAYPHRPRHGATPANFGQGIAPFTLVRPRSMLAGFNVPTVVLMTGKGPLGSETFIGVVDSKRNVATLDSIVKIVSVAPIFAEREHELRDLEIDQELQDLEIDLVQFLTGRGFRTKFRRKLKSKDSVVSLGPRLSAHIIRRLAHIEENRESLRTVFAALNKPNVNSQNFFLQQDAVNLALKAFGVSPTRFANYVETFEGRDSIIARVDAMEFRFENFYTRIYEDSVIEHDARNVPEFSIVGSDLTGRAIFQNGSEQLEVITANRRPLEEAFGVDLIYLNAMKQNVVMVQYKMLEPHRNGKKTDWLYRPDKQLEKEMERMRLFSHSHSPDALEYRINPQVFYLRFVRRDADLGKVAATMPIDHFEVLRRDPKCRGEQGAFRISYDSLNGRYLRQNSFLELLRSGYIGAHAKTTSDLESLINAILNGNRAVIGALHSARRSEN